MIRESSETGPSGSVLIGAPDMGVLRGVGGDKLRTPFLIVAIIAMGLVVLIELGSTLFIDRNEPEGTELRDLIASEGLEVDDDEIAEAEALQGDRPPGLGISYMALLDGLLLFSVGLVGLALILPERMHGRIQGIATLVLSFLLAIATIILLFIAFSLLILMVSLLTAVPFGTLAYLALYAFFDRGGASATLSILMLLKIVFAVCLILAHQRMMQNKGLVLMVVTSLIANLIVAFLHGIVPLFLVSITDAIAALIVGILAIIWAILMLIGAIVAVIRIIKIQPSVLQPS